MQGPNNQPVLTRAGSFTKDNTGTLVNAAGYTLLGYPTGSSGVANGFSGLVPVNLNAIALQATPTTTGKFYVNVPSNAAVVAAADLPSQNGPTATPTDKTSLVTYDNLGNQVTLDVYTTNEGGNVWDVAIFNAADAPATGGFPYANPALTTGTLTFDPTTGAIQAGTPTSFDIAIPNGAAVMTLDMAQTTQLATSYTVLTASTNGNRRAKYRVSTLLTTVPYP